ncbi:hypothetical protein JOF42_001959 [Microbacterium phyllosphaerae]|uniref:Uncharacterized protein n=1 Tax=Microbacterium phyllosphaerae TaxID=124798 RepID=A0ABS4WQH2_9MICO|nr:type IV toxin-antitoxin system AbiEi family antitoxin domain-containing protein [Microbacterium phyllosphaerae]MBP2378464.1 hypothetical protein [Microbacterium phyllosphaerae]
MSLEDWLRTHDGAAHTTEIYAAGFSRYVVATAVDSGRMLRLRRSWIASKSAIRRFSPLSESAVVSPA